MSRVKENWELCLKAVEYAKSGAPRSANQHYFYSKSPIADKIRHEFLLDCTRGSNYRQEGKKYVKDPQMTERRRLVQDLMTGTRPQADKKRQLDLWIDQWGFDYFEKAADLDEVFESLSMKKKWKKIQKHTGISRKEFKALSTEELADFIEMFKVRYRNHHTAKFGVGNCYEKAMLAAEYLADWSLPGRKLAICCLQKEHKGVTGHLVALFSKEENAGGGDHVFCVYDLDATSERVSEWGPNAIIVDGWMNDAYPAQEYLTWKY